MRRKFSGHSHIRREIAKAVVRKREVRSVMPVGREDEVIPSVPSDADSGSDLEQLITESSPLS